MKKLISHRIFPIFLCMMMALSLSACGEKSGKPIYDETGGTGEKLSGSKIKPDGTSETIFEGGREETEAADPEKAKESLEMLQTSMEYSQQTAGAAAYLGFREQGDSMPLTEWIQSNCSGLAEEMPFILNIPDERILGEGCGDLYCIVPRDENTSLSVNRVKWKTVDYGVWPVAEEVLYREEYAQPVLVFVNFEQWRDEPDIEVILVTNDGVEVKWCPQIDEYGTLVIPTGQYYVPVLMDFTAFGDMTGLGYPDSWELPEDSNWLPPTDQGLADTTWTCEHWLLELRRGNGDLGYSGTANLYYRENGEQYDIVYSGMWRMEKDCLRMELSDGDNYIEGNFPVQINPSGEHLYIERDRETDVCPPFFGENMVSMELVLSYG